MKYKTAYVAGLAGTCLAHLALIPILAFYGVAICPVLRGHGFALGCISTGFLVTWLLAANAIATWATQKLRARRVVLSLLYGAIFAVGATGLVGYLHSLRAPAATITRMELSLFYSSILLGVLHLVIMDGLLAIQARERRPSSRSLERPRGFCLRGALEALWEFLPQAGALTVFAVFSRRLAEAIAAGELGSASMEIAGTQLTMVGVILGCWLLVIRALRLFLEDRLLHDVKEHLDALAHRDSTHLSQTEAPSFWHDIFVSLNRASRISDERNTRADESPRKSA